jgi:hypothetical protein
MGKSPKSSGVCANPFGDPKHKKKLTKTDYLSKMNEQLYNFVNEKLPELAITPETRLCVKCRLRINKEHKKQDEESSSEDEILPGEIDPEPDETCPVPDQPQEVHLNQPSTSCADSSRSAEDS